MITLHDVHNADGAQPWPPHELLRGVGCSATAVEREARCYASAAPCCNTALRLLPTVILLPPPRTPLPLSHPKYLTRHGIGAAPQRPSHCNPSRCSSCNHSRIAPSQRARKAPPPSPPHSRLFESHCVACGGQSGKLFRRRSASAATMAHAWLKGFYSTGCASGRNGDARGERGQGGGEWQEGGGGVRRGEGRE